MDTITVQMVGANFRPASAKEIVRDFALGQRLTLEREPYNQYDANAVKVIDEATGAWVGFVPKTDNTEIAAALDEGTFTFEVTVTDFPGDLKPEITIVPTAV